MQRMRSAALLFWRIACRRWSGPRWSSRELGSCWLAWRRRGRDRAPGAVLLAWTKDAYRGIPASFGPGLDVLKSCQCVPPPAGSPAHAGIDRNEA